MAAAVQYYFKVHDISSLALAFAYLRTYEVRYSSGGYCGTGTVLYSIIVHRTVKHSNAVLLLYGYGV